MKQVVDLREATLVLLRGLLVRVSQLQDLLQ
ncbi:ORFL122C [Human betaherpesvirus 5]|nr:ORFL122C [Human betaherpesvirus 5]QHX40443.1 ORFL122C [Human betaherpesvirus 5]